MPNTRALRRDIAAIEAHIRTLQPAQADEIAIHKAAIAKLQTEVDSPHGTISSGRDIFAATHKKAAERKAEAQASSAGGVTAGAKRYAETHRAVAR